MREILFHGKRIDNGEWVEGDLLQEHRHSKRPEYESNLFYISDHTFQNGDYVGFMYKVDPETVGQHTGDSEFAIDENGTVTHGEKIFDGDIIRAESGEDGNGEFLVVWDYEKGGWQLKYLRGTRGSDCLDAIKIIGNKWDNPELLEASP